MDLALAIFITAFVIQSLIWMWTDSDETNPYS